LQPPKLSRRQHYHEREKNPRKRRRMNAKRKALTDQAQIPLLVFGLAEEGSCVTRKKERRMRKMKAKISVVANGGLRRFKLEKSRKPNAATKRRITTKQPVRHTSQTR
jgi:hypothetical protein